MDKHEKTFATYDKVLTKYYYTKIKGDSKYILQLMQHDAHTIEMDVGYYVLPECTE